MSTRTQDRILVTLKVPESLAELLDAEAKAAGTSLASLARGAVKWHGGDGLARHPDRPPVALPTRQSQAIAQKGMLLDQEDVAYLDQVGGRIGLPRTATLLLILIQYLGIDPLPRASASESVG